MLSLVITRLETTGFLTRSKLSILCSRRLLPSVATPITSLLVDSQVRRAPLLLILRILNCSHENVSLTWMLLAGSASALDMMYSPLSSGKIVATIAESGARGPHDPETY